MSGMIPSLPQSERAKLLELLTEQIKTEQGGTDQPAKAPRDKRLPSKPMPASANEAMRWIAEHRCEYGGQWVALDGYRLIAHSSSHDEVWTAALADGALLPMITFVEHPDQVVQLIWA